MMKIWCAVTNLFLITELLLGLNFSVADSCNPRDESLLEQGRRCVKACTNSSECRGVLKSCQCDNVCGLSCFNPDLNCTQLSQIDGGTVSYTAIKYGSVATYKCNSGYVIVNGSKSRTCYADKQWTGTALTCLPGCPDPGRISKGYPNPPEDQKYVVGTVVPYACNTGYTFSGTGTSITCQNDGTWTLVEFSCVRMICGHPGSPQNGIITGDTFTFGSRVYYSCRKGYDLTGGNNPRLCRATGGMVAWSGVAPTCEIKTCPAPVLPANGQVHDDGLQYVFGIQIRYSCDSGYQFAPGSPQTGTCDENETWGEMPVCEVYYSCSFEDKNDQFCGYVAENWARKFTSKDYNGRLGYFAEAAGAAKLTTRAIPLNGSNAIVSFYYTLSSSGGLRLEASTTSGSVHTWTLWSSSADPASWENVILELGNPPELIKIWESVPIKLSFVLTSGSAQLDEISITFSTSIATTASKITETASSTTPSGDSGKGPTIPPGIATTASKITETASSTTPSADSGKGPTMPPDLHPGTKHNVETTVFNEVKSIPTLSSFSTTSKPTEAPKSTTSVDQNNSPNGLLVGVIVAVFLVVVVLVIDILCCIYHQRGLFYLIYSSTRGSATKGSTNLNGKNAEKGFTELSAITP